MKRSNLIVTLLLSLACLAAKADVPVFGNNPVDSGTALGITVYNGLSLTDGTIEFTPSANIALSSVSLWLSGYTGDYGQSINASIWSSSPCGNLPWTPIANLSTPSANNGSLSEFTFSTASSLTLSAGTSYWLMVTASGEPGDYIEGASWVDGTTPTGAATFNGADNYSFNRGSFNPTSVLPAFDLNTDSPIPTNINPVPEPGVGELMVLPLLLGAIRSLYRRFAHR